MSKPWERQTGESTVAYQAAQMYFEQGAERSTASVARALGKSKTLMDRWSSAHSWVSRAAEYDSSLAEAGRLAAAKEVARMNKRHVQLAEAMQAQVAKAMAAQDPRKMTPMQMARWIQVATKLDREARGLAGDVVEHRGEMVADADLARRIAENPAARQAALSMLDALASGEPGQPVDVMVERDVADE